MNIVFFLPQNHLEDMIPIGPEVASKVYVCNIKQPNYYTYVQNLTEVIFCGVTPVPVLGLAEISEQPVKM